MFYPTTTVYVNYYLKADELGNKLVDVFDMPNTANGNFYNYIEKKNYRNSWNNTLDAFSSNLIDERDVYNVLHLDERRIKPSDVHKEETQPIN